MQSGKINPNCRSAFKPTTAFKIPYSQPKNPTNKHYILVFYSYRKLRGTRKLCRPEDRPTEFIMDFVCQAHSALQ